jgi:serine/threonine-protein kinase PknK
MTSGAVTPPRGPVLQVPNVEDARLLGTGGFSTVWRAYQPRFARWVAVKVLTFDIIDDRALHLFESECAAMGQISSHPNIVTVFDSGITADDQPYLVMELFESGTYADLAAAGAVEVPEILRMMVKIGSALETAHQAGILHRDVKPQNIFRSRFDEPALGDFGIAAIDLERAMTGAGGLTLHYSAPEVLEGQMSTVQSDLYGMGATAHTLIEGRRPFERTDGETLVENAMRIISQPVDGPRRGDCPDELADLVVRLMAKDIEERPESAAAMVEEVQAIQRRLGLDITEAAMQQTRSTQRQKPQPVHVDPVDATVERLVPGAFDDTSPQEELESIVVTLPGPSAAPVTPPEAPWWTRPAVRWVGGIAVGIGALIAYLLG